MTPSERLETIRILRQEAMHKLGDVQKLGRRDDAQAQALRLDLQETVAVLARLQRDQEAEQQADDGDAGL